MFRFATGEVDGVRGVPLTEISEEAVVRFYEALAPESLPPVPWNPSSERFGVRFGEDALAEAEPVAAPPGASAVRVLELFEDSPGPEVIVCDLLAGRVLWAPADGSGAALRPLATALAAPARVEAADLDGDGARDLVVALLGSVASTEDPVGGVVWLRRTGPREFEPVRILGKAGRVADARVADLDGDGDPDVAVASFGRYGTGRLSILRNGGPVPGALPVFAEERLDERDGAVACLVADFDGDGRPDVAALHGQQHEEAVIHRNLGGGAFRTTRAWAADHPRTGFSALAAGDLDGDGDLDLLVGNGDAHEDPDGLRPGQGVTWLENLGDGRFSPRRIGELPGVHGLAARDLDGDGDLDVVASSFLPAAGAGAAERLSIPAAAWWEQAAPGVFRPWTLATGPRDAAALEVADLDGDGRLDLLLGSFRPGEATAGPRPPLVRVLRRR
jgi:hypothetical protein